MNAMNKTAINTKVDASQDVSVSARELRALRREAQRARQEAERAREQSEQAQKESEQAEKESEQARKEAERALEQAEQANSLGSIIKHADDSFEVTMRTRLNKLMKEVNEATEKGLASIEVDKDIQGLNRKALRYFKAKGYNVTVEVCGRYGYGYDYYRLSWKK